MTLQQLEYILAVNKYRHFVRAAEACGVTQSTLSLMIHKLEDELDIVIFDRNAHPICPTRAGEDVLKQAQVVVYNARQIKELTLNERNRISGDLHIGVTPTIAPYIVPKLFRYIRQHYPEINLLPFETYRQGIVEMLKNAKIDMAIMSMPDKDDSLLEIPLFKERFFIYVSPTDPLFTQKEVCYNTLPRERFWMLKDNISFVHQLDNSEHRSTLSDEAGKYESRSYEAGSLLTLCIMVDELGGFTALPELHIPQLTSFRRKRIRPLVDPVPMRRVSLFVRRDYVRESLLNVVTDAVKTSIPSEMVEERLKKFRVRL